MATFGGMSGQQKLSDIILVCLKFGIEYKSLQVDKSGPDVLKELHLHATDMVSKVIGKLEDDNYRHQIRLFLVSPDHQPISLRLLTRPSDLTPTCFIEVIIWRSDQETFLMPRDHELVKHSYKKPTYCSACNYFMWGLVKQGKRCKLCKRDFHHQCAEHLPPDCPGAAKRNAPSTSHMSSDARSDSMISDPDYPDQDALNNASATIKRTKFGKFFNMAGPKPSLAKSTTSNSTNGISTVSDRSKWGTMPQNSPKTTNEHATKSSPTTNLVPSARTPANQNPNGSNLSAAIAQLSIRQNQRNDIKVTNCQEHDGIWYAMGQFDRESRHSKCAEIVYDKKKFRFTQKDEQGNKSVVELSAADVEAYRSHFTSMARENGQESKANGSSQQPQAIVYHNLACLLLETINEAARSTRDPRMRSSFKMVRGSGDSTKEFEDLYEVNEKDILGKGRFGMVFGGVMRRNGVRVAVKKIQLSQCSSKDRENIEQEAAFLFQLNHPGILKFEGIFNFERHILLVTERLQTDMLNFIITNKNPKARLDENVTRFLAFQLIAAIRYLHFKSIAHCDLKPDNVLLNIFPDNIVHLKVGDFGYARTIHEHSLRYTKVGTNAYLAPEVSVDHWRQARGYNKTVDMWAIGVVIFVSLTGFFPFSEDSDTLAQIQNIPKLFEDEIFSNVTEEAKDLLRRRLLVPDAGHRMHSAGVIYHDWFQKSEHLLKKCRELEECLEKKWLTLFFEDTEPTATIPYATAEETDSS